MAKSQSRRDGAEKILSYIRQTTDLPIQQMDDAYLALLTNEQLDLYLFADEEDEEAGISKFPLPYTRYLALKEELLKEYRIGSHPDYMPKQLSQKEIAMLLVYIIEDMAQGKTEFWSIYLDAEMNFTELIPMSSPLLFRRAPPLLPGLIAASVWISLLVMFCPSD